MFLKNVNRSQTIRIQFLNIEEIPHFCKKKLYLKKILFRLRIYKKCCFICILLHQKLQML